MYEALYQTVRQRYGTGNSSQSMGDWMIANTTLKSRPFSFEGYEFQRAIADDMHPDMNVKKCSQVGLTEVQIRKFLAILTRGTALNGIFTLPNEKMFTKIYNGRIKPIVNTDDVFNPPSAIQPVRRKDQIQIRDSFGYITGCTEGDATSISSDFMMHDELDLSPPEIISLFQSRIQNSDMQIIQKFSTPSFNGFGIDKGYAQSDQREYVVRCGSCNHYQIPLFTPDFVRIPDYEFDVQTFQDLSSTAILDLPLSEAQVCCDKCHKPLDLSDPSRREWVAKHPAREAFRGYQVRPFSTSRLKPDYVFRKLAQYQTDGYMRGFANTVLGESYSDSSAQLQRGDIEKCLQGGAVPEISSDKSVFLSVDIGFVCHLNLSFDDSEGNPVYFLFETVPMGALSWRIEELRKLYNIVQGGADRFPFEPDVDAIRVQTSNLIMPVQYRGLGALVPVKDELGEITHYSVNKTYVLDRIHSQITNHQVVLTGYGNQKETIIAQLMDNVRDENPESPAVWRKNTGDDHYFHSMGLGFVARRICEHFYHNVSDIKPTSAGFSAISMQQKSSDIGTHSNSGAKKISRLG